MKLEDKYQSLITLSSEYAKLVDRMNKLGGWKYLPIQDKKIMERYKGLIFRVEAQDKIKEAKQLAAL